MSERPAEPLCRRDGLRWLNARLRTFGGRTLVAVDGVDGSGKSTFADDLATLVQESGTKVLRISFDNFLNPQQIRHARGRTSPEGYFEDSYDYRRFIADVLEPLGPDGSGRYRTASYDYRTETPLNPPWQVAPERVVVIIDGMFLHRETLRTARGRKVWDLSVWLDVPFDVSVPRLAHRDGTSPDPEHPSNRRYVEGQRLYLERCEPAARADLVVSNCGDRESSG